MSALRASAASIAVLVAGCVAERTIGEHQPCPCAQGWSCDPVQNVCVASVTAGDGGTNVPTTFTADEVQAALANCGLPHGSPVVLSTPNDEKAALIGAWALCPPSMTLPQTIFTPGIRFEANGNFESLTPDGAGGLVAGVGLLSQGTWTTYCYNVDTSLVHDAANQPCQGTSPYGLGAQAHTVGGDDNLANCFVGPVSFETSPARAYVIDGTGVCGGPDANVNIELWLVPLP